MSLFKFYYHILYIWVKWDKKILDIIIKNFKYGLIITYIKYLCFGTSIALTHGLGNIYVLTQTPKPIKSDKNESRDIVSAIGKLDFYLCIMSGICLYAFPDRVNLLLGGAGTLNESYRSLTRSCGAFFLGTSLASLCMSEFKYLEDKRKFLLSRLCVSIVYWTFFKINVAFIINSSI